MGRRRGGQRVHEQEEVQKVLHLPSPAAVWGVERRRGQRRRVRMRRAGQQRWGSGWRAAPAAGLRGGLLPRPLHAQQGSCRCELESMPVLLALCTIHYFHSFASLFPCWVALSPPLPVLLASRVALLPRPHQSHTRSSQPPAIFSKHPEPAHHLHVSCLLECKQKRKESGGGALPEGRQEERTGIQGEGTSGQVETGKQLRGSHGCTHRGINENGTK